ncbi:MAG: hypothetical protein GW939_01885 [Candidatus Magasanikbacteria bacterium]|uniref:Uncharacterized protein n=1 Tax=Candidatus Magasanikbacteria bacterium CG10_big_fil_rev_8_21_14_0_10_38_6 TaxID=1974647 RepID=A0A2M6P271_9BACT|nr:hypothetical protein [Candidatus Magasanikbacteria bacterium]PIR77791.1 MAG: hypothetical protein COU30_00520 [Candidatus Magasanikbacteria bacterium CG10_big_fil_rev_8_21_14_0_10_38_6]
MQTFIFTVAKATIIQCLGVFGLFFLFGFVLYLLQKYIQKLYTSTVGWKGILFTAWIGTPIHEFSHVILAKLFRYEITDVAIFRPNKETGGLGHVEYSFKKWSVIQRIGRFFVGAAPMIIGSIFLALIFRFLMPNGSSLFLLPTNETNTLTTIYESTIRTLTTLFSFKQFSSWNFWLTLYISFCIASHIAPSKQDRKQMWSGLVWLLVFLGIVNAIALWAGVNITELILKTNHFLGVFTAMFTYAVVISFLHLLITTIILKPFSR